MIFHSFGWKNRPEAMVEIKVLIWGTGFLELIQNEK
jgi:hypothetical protein